MASESGRLGARADEVQSALGPLALEGILLADLAAETASVKRDARRLARPLVIVVPSHSLRRHVAARAVASSRAPLAGVAFETLHGLAASVLRRAGEPEPRGASLFAAFVRRHAARNRTLEREFAHLDDGWKAIVGTLGDLFDAGFGAAHEAALLEALAAPRAHAHAEPRARRASELERAGALVRVAGATARDLEQLGLGRSTAIYERAAHAIARDPALVRARAVWIHGFADATAPASDLLATLQRAVGARVYFDATLAERSPTRPERRFGERLRERLAIAARVLREPPLDTRVPRASQEERLARAPELAGFRAPGRQSEVREVAQRIARLLARGVEPERIGVVARDLGPWRLALRLHFRRLSIPYSALSAAGSPGPVERRARALAELVQRGADLSVERWLDARAPLSERSSATPTADAGGAPHAAGTSSATDDASTLTTTDAASPPTAGDGASSAPASGVALRRAHDFDLLLALRALGAVRLRHVRDLDLETILGERDAYPLPVRRGARASVGEAPEESADGAAGVEDERAHAGSLRRRYVGRRTLERARGDVRELCAFLAAAPERASSEVHATRLRRLVRRHLHWRPHSPGYAALEAALASVEGDLPPSTSLAEPEFRLIFERALAEHSETPLGGLGAGVACLSVAEARARTFEHLFVVGLNHGQFPRTVREDPLLSDELRRRLGAVLPDLALRALGYDEERFLFEQLVRAAPSVTLSWQTVDDEGKAQVASSFVERLFAGGSESVELAPPVLPRDRASVAAGGDLRPAHEHATLAALHGTRADFARLLPGALGAGLEAVGAGGGDDALRGDAARTGAARTEAATRSADARVKILDEIDPPPAGRSRLGPYFGFVGALAREQDLRQGDVYVTTLERMADCPWRTFVTHLLRVEPVPDPLDTLPSVDARMVGNLVHAVLQRIVSDALDLGPDDAPRTLAELADATPRAVVWPSPARVDVLAEIAAREILRDEGIVLLGLGRVLVEQARPLLEVARRVDAEEAKAGAGALGAEVSGEYASADGRGADGAPGRILRFVVDRVDRVGGALRLTDYKTGASIADRKRSETRDKHFLQRVESGRSLQAVVYALAAGARAQGRYLFLKPEIADDARRFHVDADAADGAGAGRWLAAYERATSALFHAWRAGSFVPRLVDAGLAREHKSCPYCEVSQTCLRGDSGARTRLVRWARAAAVLADGADGGPEHAAWTLWQLGRDSGAGASGHEDTGGLVHGGAGAPGHGGAGAPGHDGAGAPVHDGAGAPGRDAADGAAP